MTPKKKEKPKVVKDDTDYEKEAEEEKEQEKKSNIYFLIAIGTIVVLIVAFITIPTLLSKVRIENDSYNSFIFQKKDKFWTTDIERNGLLNTVPFYYHPRELENIPSETNLSAKIFSAAAMENASIIITLDPDLNSTAVQAAVQISRITGERYDIFNIPTHSAITNPPKEYQGNATFPIKTCKDASDNTVVIWLRKGEINGIISEGNCIIIQGTDESGLLRSAEKFTYILLGIMK